MYRPIRKWAWDEKAEQAYNTKRAKMAEKGYVTDEQVCQYFIDNGVTNCEPQDIRPMILDAVTERPLESLLRSLN
jgi:hypothetical protein